MVIITNQSIDNLESLIADASTAIEANNRTLLERILNESKLFDRATQKNIGELFLMAVDLGRRQIVKDFLRHNIDCNYANDDNITPLMTATKRNDVETVNLLISSGAKLNTLDCYEWTPLMYASYYGAYESAKLLLESGAWPNVFDADHMSCLIWSAGRGYANIVTLLIEWGAKVDAADKYGTSALIWASRKGYTDVVNILLKAGANVDATGMFGFSALLVAVQGNFIETTKVLLAHKPNVNTCDAQKLSPLMVAAKDGFLEIAQLLIRDNAFVNLSDFHGQTALIHAVKSGHVEIVRELVKANADLDHVSYDRKWALFWAVEKSHIEVVDALLAAGPNLELASKDGETCLIKAVKLRKLDIVKMLLDNGAKVGATDKNGDTALHLAARTQSKAIVELILANPKHCQLIYKPNKRKETPYSIDQSNLRPVFPTLLDQADKANNGIRRMRLSEPDTIEFTQSQNASLPGINQTFRSSHNTGYRTPPLLPSPKPMLTRHHFANVSVNKFMGLETASPSTNSDEIKRRTLRDMSVQDIIDTMRNIDGFDTQALDNKYSKIITENNINGNVLANLEVHEERDLRMLVQFSFGDWTLFKKFILRS